CPSAMMWERRPEVERDEGAADRDVEEEPERGFGHERGVMVPHVAVRLAQRVGQVAGADLFAAILQRIRWPSERRRTGILRRSPRANASTSSSMRRRSCDAGISYTLPRRWKVSIGGR